MAGKSACFARSKVPLYIFGHRFHNPAYSFSCWWTILLFPNGYRSFWTSGRIPSLHFIPDAFWQHDWSLPFTFLKKRNLFCRFCRLFPTFIPLLFLCLCVFFWDLSITLQLYSLPQIFSVCCYFQICSYHSPSTLLIYLVNILMSDLMFIFSPLSKEASAIILWLWLVNCILL